VKHFYDRRAKAEPTSAGYLRAWCGREIRHNQTTLRLTAVECVKCREAFARELAKLPDVDEAS